MGDGAEKILLIHGFGGDSDRWLFTQQPLSEKATVYAFDLPGHGQSSKNVDDGTVSGLAETVMAFLDSLEITEARLIGHSLGGAIALQAAISYPNRVTRLDLIAPAGLGEEINRDYINGFIETDNRKEMKGLLQQLVADPELVNRALVNDMLQFKRTDGVADALSQIAAGFINDQGRQSRVMREEAALLTIPINLIWGSLDKIIPAEHAKELPAQIKSTVLEGYGHLVQLEAATEVNAILEQ
jgi:pyruvate dehydrogenase E2 component (dihydrolipoamide acetyltransferase)